jgi:hypothetical protein
MTIRWVRVMAGNVNSVFPSMEMKEENLVTPAERNPAEDRLAQGLRIFDEIFPEYRGVLVRHLLIRQRGDSKLEVRISQEESPAQNCGIGVVRGLAKLLQTLACLLLSWHYRLIWSGQNYTPRNS